MSAEEIARLPPTFGAWVAKVQATAWIVATSSTIVVGVIELYKRIVGPPWLWATLHEFLDIFRSDVFARFGKDPDFDHRATVFRRRTWTWKIFSTHRPYFRGLPWSGWLVPVERSGHTRQKTRVMFRASDAADKLDGVAGRCWRTSRTVLVTGLPDVSNEAASDSDVADYSEKTFVTVGFVRSQRPTSRSFLGVPVVLKGVHWGVLVLDSCKPDGITETTSEEKYRPFAEYLGKLLEQL